MNKTWLPLLMMCWSCGGDQARDNEIAANTNTASWQQDGVEKINHDPPVTSSNSDAQKNVAEQEESILVQKGEWGTKEGQNSFLHSPSIDSLVAQKNKRIRQHMIQSDGGESSVDVLGEKFLKGLPAKELVYYCLAYPAYSSQNCSAFPIPEDGGKYFAHFLPVEQHISAVQVNGLRQKRDSVCMLLKKLIAKTDTVDIEVLDLVHRANLFELLPDLCKKASFGKNPYVYTLLMNMMNSNHYTVFTQSAYYNNLLQNVHPNGSIRAKKTDADSLVQYALKFYRSTTLK